MPLFNNDHHHCKTARRVRCLPNATSMTPRHSLIIVHDRAAMQYVHPQKPFGLLLEFR